MALNKNLEKLTAQIQKKYGESMVALATDRTDREIITHPSGSLMLDLAIGNSDRAGIPEGRIMEVYGPESAGKCLPKDAQILTPSGYRTIEDIFEENGTPVVNTTKTVLAEIPLINRYGDIEKTQALTFNGSKKLIGIQTQTGIEHKGTFNHPLLVLENHYPIWKRMSDIKPGDFIVSRRGDNHFSSKKQTSLEDAYVLGLLIADGYLSEEKVTFSNNESTLIKEFEGFCSRHTGKELKKYEDERGTGCTNVHLNGRKATDFISSTFGISFSLAAQKRIPQIILSSDRETILSFLSGYIECEGYTDAGKGIEISSASEMLLKEIQLVLRNLGVISSLNQKQVVGYEENYYGRLFVSGKNADHLFSLLTFKTDKRKAEKEKYLTRGTHSTSHMFDFVPNLDELLDLYIQSIAPSERLGILTRDSIDKGHATTRDKTRKILELGLNGDPLLKEHIESLLDEGYFYDIVLSTEELPAEPTFDVVMPQTHSFVSNGLVNHNTTVCLLAIASRQKEEDMKEQTDPAYEKKYCIFVDAEHALDFQLAEEYGVDLNELIYINPESAEQAMDVVDAYVRSGEIGLVVVDSVPALVPSSMGDSSFEQQHMGTIARFMSGVCQRMAGPLFKHKTTLIFINQIREKIGGFSPVGTQTNTGVPSTVMLN